MQLTLWTYEGPPHIGAMRVATAMRGLHYVLHAPQGDTYADLLFTMIESPSAGWRSSGRRCAAAHLSATPRAAPRVVDARAPLR